MEISTGRRVGEYTIDSIDSKLINWFLQAISSYSSKTASNSTSEMSTRRAKRSRTPVEAAEAAFPTIRIQRADPFSST
jgi:hypothetical protein